jgi:hypothetical protein
MTFLSNFSLLAHCIAQVLLRTGLGPAVLILGLYNFQRRFVPKILSGEKTHTIRGLRANPDKPGNLLHLYTGLRQKGAKLLMRVPCLRVEEIEIRAELALVDPPSGDVWRLVKVFVGNQRLSIDECEALARRDGFESFAEMMKFWDGRLPFRGHIIHWQFPSTSSGGSQLADASDFNSSKVEIRATRLPRKVRRSA